MNMTLSGRIIIGIISIFMFVSMVVVALAGPARVAAQSFDENKNAVCEGIGSGNCGTAKADSEKKINETIKNITYILGFIGGTIAVIMIIIGGLKYITSNGDAAQASSAKNTILYAIIGLVVVLIAQIIVQFVISRFK